MKQNILGKRDPLSPTSIHDRGEHNDEAAPLLNQDKLLHPPSIEDPYKR